MAETGTEAQIGWRVSRVLVLFLYGFAIVCTVILAMAFFLQLFNANEATPFVRWVFRATDRIMQPFRGIFPAVEGESGSLFDPALLFAMFMYWLFALGMHALVSWIDRKIAAARYQERMDPGRHSAPAPVAPPPSPPPPSGAGPAA
ncbi:MAG TPA: YggT family protein [Actinomycetota bacterium]|nr:YggT family protein [Actinomycetota bacterium]